MLRFLHCGILRLEPNNIGVRSRVELVRVEEGSRLDMESKAFRHNACNDGSLALTSTKAEKYQIVIPQERLTLRG